MEEVVVVQGSLTILVSLACCKEIFENFKNHLKRVLQSIKAILIFQEKGMACLLSMPYCFLGKWKMEFSSN